MVVIKLQNASDIRRIQVEDDISFDNIKTKIQEAFGASLPNDYTLKCEDPEKELVSITNDDELREAIRITDKFLKIVVVHPWIPVSIGQKLPFYPKIQVPCHRRRFGAMNCASAYGVGKQVVHCGNAWWKKQTPAFRMRLAAFSLFILYMMSHSTFFFLLTLGAIYFGFNWMQSKCPAMNGQNQARAVPAQPNPPPYNPDAPSQVDSAAKEAFANNLKKLEELGFTDKTRNIGVLIQAKGNLEESIRILLG
eukprot:TRINITY_DN3770_c0_g1_i1.p1 TRINITY_DN3770_c0_g1~~TRINITY_DN3770_c0_g1_i1.p1  ORF type:complete len:251 (-),score=80.80 TRINITY_DN3770_c0_g1_i1:195-947(-)